MNEQILYNLIIEYFKGVTGTTQISNVISGLNERVRVLNGEDRASGGSHLSPTEEKTANEIIWDLVVQRIISIDPQGWPFLYVTAYGQQVIRSAIPIPYDRDNYLQYLYALTPNLPDIVKFYLEESLVCLRGGAYKAGAVMLGVAAEALMEMLITAFQNKYSLKTILIDPSKFKPFGQIRDAFKKQFEPRKQDLLQKLKDDLETMMDGLYLLIKNARDDAGHPTGTHITREQFVAYLNVFPMYCERLGKIIDFYK